jgi:hypothetical protein
MENAYFLALFMDLGRFKMNATLSFETLGTTYPATHPHISEDQNPRLRRCDNLKPCTVFAVFAVL